MEVRISPIVPIDPDRSRIHAECGGPARGRSTTRNPGGAPALSYPLGLKNQQKWIQTVDPLLFHAFPFSRHAGCFGHAVLFTVTSTDDPEAGVSCVGASTHSEVGFRRAVVSVWQELGSIDCRCSATRQRVRERGRTGPRPHPEGRTVNPKL